MADVPYMPVFCEPLLADTDHLSDAEMGLYTRMLVKLWLAPRQRFPSDLAWLARKFRKTPAEAESTLLPLVEEFFQRDGNWISHKRLSREFARVSSQLQKQSDRAKSRWNKENCKSRGNAGPAMPTTPTSISTDSTVTVESDSEPIELQPIAPQNPPPTSRESATPHASGSEPIEVGVGGIADPPSTRDFIDRCMIFGANPELTLRKVRVWTSTYGRDRTESAIVDALMIARRNPVGLVEEILSKRDNKRFAAVETAKHREQHGKPDPVMEADRMLRATFARMETSNDDDAASHPGLTH